MCVAQDIRMSQPKLSLMEFQNKNRLHCPEVSISLRGQELPQQSKKEYMCKSTDAFQIYVYLKFDNALKTPDGKILQTMQSGANFLIDGAKTCADNCII